MAATVARLVLLVLLQTEAFLEVVVGLRNQVQRRALAVVVSALFGESYESARYQGWRDRQHD